MGNGVPALAGGMGEASVGILSGSEPFVGTPDDDRVRY
jgi:hypothetical protein